MKNKLNKLNKINIALATGITAIIPYNVFATDTKTLVSLDWGVEYAEQGLEQFESIIQTSDGGYVVVGEADVRKETGGSRGDAVIVKYDKEGTKQWDNTIVGNDTDLFYNVVETENGDFYAIGKSYSSDLDFTNDTNIANAIIVKYNKTGNKEWIKAVSDNGKQINYNKIINTKSGNLAIIGDKVIDGERTGFLMVVDSNGDEVSSVAIKEGTNNTKINDVIEVSDDKYLVIGTSTVDKNEKPFISVVNSSGQADWSYSIKKDESDILNILNGEFVSVLKSKNNDNYVVAGYITNENGDEDSLLMTFDKDGKRLWYNIDRGEMSDRYTTVMENSKNEIIVLGENKPNGDINKLEEIIITVTKYVPGSDKVEKIDDFGNTAKNISASSGVITSDDKIISAGKIYKKVQGLDSKCEVTKASLPEECIQADAIIMKLSVKTAEIVTEEPTTDPCEIKTPPVIDAKDIEIYVGEEFKVMLNVTAKDKDNKDITNSIKILTNNVNVNKAGEYKVEYSVFDDCGVTANKEIKVIVKEKATNSSESLSKPQTGDYTIKYLILGVFSMFGLKILNKKKK